MSPSLKRHEYVPQQSRNKPGVCLNLRKASNSRLFNRQTEYPAAATGPGPKAGMQPDYSFPESLAKQSGTPDSREKYPLHITKLPPAF